MHKKYYLMNIISHAVVIASLFFPLINVNELRIGVAGAGVADPYYMNIVSFLQNEIYPLTGFLMIGLMVLSTLGVANSVYGLVTKRVNTFTTMSAFLLGFSSAALAALLLYSSSTVLFIICAISFAICSYCSIKLFRVEESISTETQGE